MFHQNCLCGARRVLRLGYGEALGSRQAWKHGTQMVYEKRCLAQGGLECGVWRDCFLLPMQVVVGPDARVRRTRTDDQRVSKDVKSGNRVCAWKIGFREMCNPSSQGVLRGRSLWKSYVGNFGSGSVPACVIHQRGIRARRRQKQ